ncbi:hypothetical protein IJT93_04730 [bacterium]|nr:hypothetical protein [bacterium]
MPYCFVTPSAVENTALYRFVQILRLSAQDDMTGLVVSSAANNSEVLRPEQAGSFRRIRQRRWLDICCRVLDTLLPQVLCAMRTCPSRRWGIIGSIAFSVPIIEMCDFLCIIYIEMCEFYGAEYIELCIFLTADSVEKCGDALCYTGAAAVLVILSAAKNLRLNSLMQILRLPAQDDIAGSALHAA